MVRVRMKWHSEVCMVGSEGSMFYMRFVRRNGRWRRWRVIIHIISRAETVDVNFNKTTF